MPGGSVYANPSTISAAITTLDVAFVFGGGGGGSPGGFGSVPVTPSGEAVVWAGIRLAGTVSSISARANASLCEVAVNFLDTGGSPVQRELR